MQTSTRDFGMEPRFSMREARFIISRDIWLALDDSHQDGRRNRQQEALTMEFVNEQDVASYHRQLFYWLLIRCGPCIFSREATLHHGTPVWRPPTN